MWIGKGPSGGSIRGRLKGSEASTRAKESIRRDAIPGQDLVEDVAARERNQDESWMVLRAVGDSRKFGHPGRWSLLECVAP